MRDAAADLPPRQSDGCYHPASEEELCALVRHASRHCRQLRVIGSSHSVWRAIVTDSFAGADTPEDEVLVVLDRYTDVFEPQDDPSHPGTKLVEVQAGCHVGLSPTRPQQARIIERPAQSDVLQPSPWHQGDWEKSLTWKLHHRYRLALPDLGGISHQTVAGFLSTGSAGGTVKWSVHEAIARLRVIDANGDVTELAPHGPDADWFRAAGIGLGLCGVISTVTFRCVPTFDIVGKETVSAASKSDVLDFYGNRPDSGLPSLEEFLLKTDYARILWWPQRNFDRLVVWQARRAPFDPNRTIKPYREIAVLPVASQVAANVIYTVLGNLDDPERAVELLEQVRARPDADLRTVGQWLRRWLVPPADPAFPERPQEAAPYLSALVQILTGQRHSPVTLGAAWILVVELLLSASDEVLDLLLRLPVLRQLFRLLGRFVPEHIDTVLGLFITTGPGGAPVTQHFEDRAFLGLPMDNQMDDLMMPTWFTELWFPFTPGDGKVQQVISRMKQLFNADGTAAGMFRATGAFAFELYAAKADPTFFLSPAAGHQHVFRVDPFWWANNGANPLTDFFPRLWDALEPLGFRLHWGKFLPKPNPRQSDALTRRYPDFARWDAVRRRVDPRGLFLTRYWKEHLGL
jgi:hypothetical protein